MTDFSLLLDCAAACAGTYENFPATFEAKQHDAHVYLSEVQGKLCLANEGTQSFQEWLRDFQALAETPHAHPLFGPLHRGLWETVDETFQDEVSYLADLGWPEFILTGHSKGAGEVLIKAARFEYIGHPPAYVAAFEAPRMGSQVLCGYLWDITIVQTATVNAARRDIVTLAPDGPMIPLHPLHFWTDMRNPIRLPVPNSYDEATMHRIPAVLSAVARLAASG